MGPKGVAKRPFTKRDLAVQEKAKLTGRAVAEKQAGEARNAAALQRQRDREATASAAFQSAREAREADATNAATAAAAVIRREREAAALLSHEIKSKRCLSKEMHAFYVKIKKKSFHAEHLFNPGSAAGATTEMIAARGWQNFVAEQTPVKPFVVWEFYVALAANRDATSVKVRGVTVDFSAAAINELYEIPEVDNSQFKALEADPDLDVMLRELAYPGTRWVGDPAEIKTSEFSRISRAWIAFICHSLKSTTRFNYVTWHRVIVLYAICTGCDIDVGHMIMEDIQTCAAFSQTSNIGHPSLVTHLCTAAGVPIDPEETTLAPPLPFDHISFANLKTLHTEPENPHGLGFLLPDPEDDPPAAPAAPAAPPLRQKRRCQNRGEASSSRVPPPKQPDSFNLFTMYSMMMMMTQFHRNQRAWMIEMGERQVIGANHRAEWESVYMANQNDFVHPAGAFAYVYPAYPERLREPFPAFPPLPEFGQQQQEQQEDQQEPEQQPTPNSFAGDYTGGPYRGI